MAGIHVGMKNQDQRVCRPEQWHKSQLELVGENTTSTAAKHSTLQLKLLLPDQLRAQDTAIATATNTALGN